MTEERFAVLAKILIKMATKDYGEDLIGMFLKTGAGEFEPSVEKLIEITHDIQRAAGGIFYYDGEGIK